MDREVFQQQFGLIGDSPALKQVVNKVMQVSKADITVLLQGESGVGKDVTARAIHGLSERKHNDLIIVNCGAIPEGIIESELFGHEKGAFTGANETRQGYFEKANGGTIFLDEIGDTPKNVQVKLLRILENGEFFRVGSSKLQTTDVRVIAATNKDLWEMVQEGTFREDLYYRLDTVQIHLPPLRERSEDIIPIFRNFVEHFSRRYDSVFRGFSDEAKALLTSYRWPGNIRELRNVAEQLVVLEKSQFVDAEKLQKYLKGRQRVGASDNLPMVNDSSHFQQEASSSTQGQNTELIYRALLEMRTDIGDVKKMIANLVYSLFSTNKPNNLPALAANNSPSESFNKNEFDVSSSYYASEDRQLEDGRNTVSSVDNLKTDEFESYEESLEEEANILLKGDYIPSLEETERFLIERALEVFDGNRRKASETLGISERTLYRKLDQFGLDKK
ncbi:MAG: sigma-54-dependent Fis family transcriptional regulator [Bacteroidetes bacterium]|nr:sigma-54-dependent Fis family transcriptional regulator [Bacteroidota bacterium]